MINEWRLVKQNYSYIIDQFLVMQAEGGALSLVFLRQTSS